MFNVFAIHVQAQANAKNIKAMSVSGASGSPPLRAAPQGLYRFRFAHNYCRLLVDLAKAVLLTLGMYSSSCFRPASPLPSTFTFATVSSLKKAAVSANDKSMACKKDDDQHGLRRRGGYVTYFAGDIPSTHAFWTPSFLDCPRGPKKGGHCRNRFALAGGDTGTKGKHGSMMSKQSDVRY